MLKRHLAPLGPLMILIAVAPTAQAAARTQSIKLIIRDTPVSKQGLKQTTAGLISGAPFGTGVESIAERVTAATHTSIGLRGAIHIYTPHGSVTGTLSFNVTLAANGSASGLGSGQITGGSGSYSGAHGTFEFAGTEAANSPIFVIRATGKVTY
jgi:hypothetical protein